MNRMGHVSYDMITNRMRRMSSAASIAVINKRTMSGSRIDSILEENSDSESESMLVPSKVVLPPIKDSKKDS